MAVDSGERSKPDTQPIHHPVPSIQDTESLAQRDARMRINPKLYGAPDWAAERILDVIRN